MSKNLNQTVRQIAAIDLGSNSFHMVVAKVVGQDLQLVSRHKQRVRLAQGLDEQKNMSNAAIERGLECLAMFAERLTDFAPDNVRIAATHTLRQANNAHIFIQRAKEILPFPIEVIPGEEEARLIYLGVAHTQTESPSKLVIDIGGGSTELIIGNHLSAKYVNSKQMGCVSFSDKYFAQGKLAKINFVKAILATEQKIEPLTNQYKKHGWDLAIGSSGTIKAIKEVLIGMNYSDGIITPKRLEKLIKKLCEFGSVDNLKLSGLSEERKPVFAAGVAILSAILQDLDVSKLHYSDGALREGLLYEMEERFHRTDIRMRTTESLAEKHHVDIEHANNVKLQAHLLLNQSHQLLGIKQNSELFDLLDWAALLHEVGLSIAFRAFHRHSAYILRHTTMPGFNTEQQLLLSTLARFQRKALKIYEMPSFNLFKDQQVIDLIRILRIAILVNGQRSDAPQLDLAIKLIDTDHWVLTCTNQHWLEDNKLLAADFFNEQELWESIGWQLSLPT